MEFKEIVGLTFKEVTFNSREDKIDFLTDTGDIYHMYHEQDCCEGVGVEDIVGDLNDIINTPILSAEAATSNENPKVYNYGSDLENDTYTDDSWTWTFYNIRTIRGDVTIRWYGSSNGYYSESVTFEKEGELKWWEMGSET